MFARAILLFCGTYMALTSGVRGALPTPDDIFRRAEEAWQMRVIPKYESFTLRCADTFLSATCATPTDDVEFTVRMSDGRTSAHEIPGGTVILRGGYIFGPGGAPLGFYRRVDGKNAPSPQPPNFAPDPFMKTIAAVTSVARVYDVRLEGEESIDGHQCYHIQLRPLLDPYEYPLRDLWIDESTYDIRALTYAWDFGDNHPGLVHYRFAAFGPQGIWAITHIDATVVARYGLFSNRTDRVSDDLRNITFPSIQPAEDFIPPASSKGQVNGWGP